MAVDGNLIFKTKIDSDGFTKGTKELSSKTIELQNKIAAAENEVKNLRAELEALGNTKVKPKVAEGLEKNIAEAKKQLKYYQRQMNGIRFDTRSSLSRADIESDTALERALSKDSKYQQAKRNAQEYQAQLISLERDLRRVNSAAPLAKDTAEYRQKQQRLEQLTGQIDVYKAKLRETEQAERSAGSSAQSSAERLKTVKTWLDRTISGLKKLGSLAKAAGSRLKSAFSTALSSSVKKIGSQFSTLNSKTNILDKSLKRIKGRLTRMFFARLVTVPLNAIKDGLGEIAKINPAFNKNLSAIASSFNFLKSSFAAAAAPIVSALTPAITTLFNTIANGLNTMGEFMSLISGKNIYSQAVKNQTDYAKSLEASTDSTNKNTKATEKNQHALASFDEIKTMDKSSTSDSTAATAAAADFKNVTAGTNSLAKTLAGFFKKENFSGLGKAIGKKISNALDKIPWSDIKNKLRKTAKNIGNFLNGFLAGMDWKLVGRTIAQGIGAGLLFAYTLLNTFDFSLFGKAIGNLINGLVSPENMALLSETLSTFVVGIGSTLVSLISTVDWGAVSNAIIAFISNFKFANISRVAISFVNSLAQALTKVNFKGIGAALRKGLSKINWKGLWNGVSSLFTNGLKAITDFFGLKGVSVTKLKGALTDLYKPATELFKTLKESASKLIKPIVNNFLPAVVNLLGSIFKAVSPIVKALTPIFEKVIKVVSGIASSFAPVIKTLGSTIGKIIGMLSPIIKPVLGLIDNVAKLLAPAIELIFGFIGKIADFLSPVTNVIGGLINGVNSLFGALTGSAETTISDKLQKELDNLASISGDLDTIKDDIYNTISSVDENIGGIATDIGQIDELQKRLDTLMNKATLSDDDVQQIKTIADVLGDKLPGFKDAWNKIIGEDGLNKDTFVKNRNEMKKSIDDVINNLKKQYVTEALGKQQTALMDEKTRVTAKYNQEVGKLQEAQAKLNSLERDRDFELERNKRLQADRAKATGAEQDKLDQAISKSNEKLKTLNSEYDKQKSATDKAKSSALELAGAQGVLDSKMKSISNAIGAMSGKLTKNWQDLQKVRDAYDMGLIPADKLKSEFNVTADELYKGTMSATEKGLKGFDTGLKNGQKYLNSTGIKLSNDLMAGIEKPIVDEEGKMTLHGKTMYSNLEGSMRDISDTHSPSYKMELLGIDLIEGLNAGIEGRMKKTLNLVKRLTNKILEGFSTGLSGLDNTLDFLPDTMREYFNKTLDYFEKMLAHMTNGLNNMLGQMDKMNQAYAKLHGEKYTAYTKFNPVRVPRLATGTVVPANYGEFLAVLGDNRREAEVVSPVSKIEEAVENVLARRGLLTADSNRTIHATFVLENGAVLFDVVGNEDDKYRARHGASRFAGGTA